MAGTNNETLTPIERVSKMIAERYAYDWEMLQNGRVYETTIDALTIFDMVRAALAAIEEPTPKMLAAGWAAVNPNNEKLGERFGPGPALKEAWSAMIRAAVEEK